MLSFGYPRLAVCVVSLCLLLSLPALAASNLDGLTLTANWDFPAIGTFYEGSTPGSGVVGPSDLLFTMGPFNTAMDINVSASTNTITLLGQYNGCGGTCNGGPYASGGGITFNGFVISLLHPPAGFAFTGVQIQSINWDNQTPAISFNGDNIYVNMAGLSQIGPGSDIVLSYNTVPEPSSVLDMLASGTFASLGLMFNGRLRQKLFRR